MPSIALFYGIAIKMYFRQSEHNPPHVHALYQDYAAAIGIRTRTVLDGGLPPRAFTLAACWIALHERELLDMWATQEFRKLPPLE